jgi:hypothetical protein
LTGFTTSIVALCKVANFAARLSTVAVIIAFLIVYLVFV